MKLLKLLFVINLILFYNTVNLNSEAVFNICPIEFQKQQDEKKTQYEIDLNIKRLIKSISWVESRHNSSAFNKSENAIGQLQIRPIMIREVNRICKLNNIKEKFSHHDAWDYNKSIKMFLIWYSFYRFNDNYQMAARNWNGGPLGYKKESTIKYWNKVKNKFNT